MTDRTKRFLARVSLGLVVVVMGAADPGAGPARVEAAPATEEEVAVLRTPHGEIVWRFFPQEAPGHVAYVKELIRRGFYDGTTFHRVIPHFVIQGGDPNSKNEDRSDDGWGEADRTLKGEFSPALHYRPGTVGMARDADPDSGSCQFFIALENIPRLDGNYSIFGEVISGLDIARKIADLPRDLNDNPLERVTVTATLEKRPVSGEALSWQAGESGETITGPGRRPRFLDPGNKLWSAPRMKPRAAEDPSGGRRARGRLEVTVDLDGSVIDVRFPEVDTVGAAALRARALSWSFQPVLYEGEPQLVRFEVESNGTKIGPTTGGGAPLEVGEGIAPPRPAVAVELAAGRNPPQGATTIRLTIDPAGNVTEAALQESCGDPALDRAAVEAARRMAFSPVTRGTTPDGSPNMVAVYMNVEARFLQKQAE
jgi:peptidyl-prolyl cis-trans isomerase B (cyclophilin B)